MRIFGTFLVLWLMAGSSLFGQTSLKSRINFKVEEVTISSALEQLQDQSGIPIAYSSSFFNEAGTITLDLNGQPLEQVLKRLLASTNISYKSLKGQIVLYENKKPLQYTVSGYLMDGPSGEKLVFATVYCRKNRKSAISNEYGFYSLTLPPGEIELLYDYVGSESVEKHVNLQGDLALDVSLNPGALLAEVIVKSNDENQGQSVGFEAEGRIPIKFFKAVPDLGGENDVMRTAQMLPGIQTGADGSGGMYVRGGDAGQNLVLLDGVPVYNPSHLLGIFSVFNSTAVRSVHMLKGGFPARYGGGISSVFDIRTREGSQKKWNVDAGLGLLSGRLSIDGPIIKDKLSVMVTARRNHSTFLFLPSFEQIFVPEDSEDIITDFSFFDINTKLNYKFSNRDRLIFSHYLGGDFFEGEFNADTDDTDQSFTNHNSILKWGNQVTSLRWNHQFGKKVFSNTTLTYSNYNFNNRILNIDFIENEFDESYEYFDFGSSIRDYALHVDVDYIPLPNHHIRMGAGIRRQENGLVFFGVEEFSLNIPQFTEELDIESLNIDSVVYDFTTTELFAYAEDDFNINENWKANLGLRVVSNSIGRNRFTRFEPRFSTHYIFNKKWSLQASLTRMSQYLHKVSFSTLQHPGDLWLPSVDGIKPQTSWQGGLGLSHQFSEKTTLSVEGYYKKMENIISIGVTTSGDNFESDFLSELGLVNGEGRTYGLEVLLQQQDKKTGGWLSYSLAWAEREYRLENLGNSFPFQYDSRHQLKLFIYHQFSDRLQLGLNWLIFSPIPYLVIDEGALSIQALNSNVNPEGQFNSLRSDVYHRLDLSLSYDFETGQRFKHFLKLGVFNVYNRKNPLYYEGGFFGSSGNLEDFIEPVNLLPLLPSLQYGLKF